MPPINLRTVREEEEEDDVVTPTGSEQGETDEDDECDDTDALVLLADRLEEFTQLFVTTKGVPIADVLAKISNSLEHLTKLINHAITKSQ